MKQFFLFFVMAFSISVFADEIIVPEFMNGTWEQASREQEVDKITFTTTYNSATGGFDKITLVTQDQSRQVGSEDTPDIPYETICRYRNSGVVTAVGAPSDDTRNQYASNGKEAPTYSVSFKVSKVELLPALYNSPNCRRFIAREKELAAAGNLNYTWNMTDLMDDVIMDPWNGTIFVKRR